MKYLIDQQSSEVQRKLAEYPHLVTGQLLTPLSRYNNWGGWFAIDNGAFSGLDREGWFRLLSKHKPQMENCLFVAIPDIVGNARRTHELFGMITQEPATHPWSTKWCLVLQDGIEDTYIDWNMHKGRALFVGGTDRFKDSSAAWDIVKTAKAIGDIHVHVGRVNTWSRFKTYLEVGADTCDGSGVSKYDHMLRDIAGQLAGDQQQPKLFGETG